MSDVSKWSRWIPAPLRRLVQSSEPYRQTAAFLAGFGYDSATLRRIDQLFDNLLLLFYLVLLGVLLVLEQRLAHERQTGWRWLRRQRHLMEVAIEFLFGGLFGAYVIFYFKSASFGLSFLFVAALAALLLFNEYRGHHLRAERLRLALYYFTVFSFLLYFVPVATGWLGAPIFVLAGLGAAAVGAVLTWLIYRGAGRGAGRGTGREAGRGAVAEPLESPEGAGAGLPPPAEEVAPPGAGGRPRASPLRRALLANGALWGGLFAVLALFYRLNVIPPVPFSLVRAGIFHAVVADRKAGYRLTYEKPPWWRFWQHDDEPFRLRPRAPSNAVYCFTAVFAPRGLATEVWHRWQRFDERRGRWTQSDRIPFDVRGGRREGYRGYTYKRHVRPGRWRVVVEAGDGRELGRVNFEIVEGPHPEPRWRSEVY